MSDATRYTDAWGWAIIVVCYAALALSVVLLAVEWVATPKPVIAPCDRCRRPIYVGRPYVMIRPGVFAHRGPCQVVR